MQRFDGFQRGSSDGINIRVPERFFWDLLPKIDNLTELKVTLYCLWVFQRQEGEYRYVRLTEALGDTQLLTSLSDKPQLQAALVREGLERATLRNTLLAVTADENDEVFYFPNSQRGREAVQAIAAQQWYPQRGQRPLTFIVEQPTIFDVYQNEIGNITPMVAEALRQAEAEFPQQWLLDAIQIAVERNVRHWKYIQVILDRWAAHGRQAGYETARRSDEQSSSDNIDYTEFFER